MDEDDMQINKHRFGIRKNTQIEYSCERFASLLGQRKCVWEGRNTDDYYTLSVTVDDTMNCPRLVIAIARTDRHGKINVLIFIPMQTGTRRD